MKNMEQKVLSYIEQHSDELDNLLSRLIQIPSINYTTHGDEYKCEEIILTEYRKMGLKAEKYCPDMIPGVLESPGYLPGRGTDRRPNFSGIYHAPGSRKKVMLAAHTDVMPVGDIAQWSVEPFGGEIKDGRIYGRGANDNKFGIASSIMALKAIQECGIELESDVVLEAYCDEEYGGGNGALAAGLKHKPDAIVNMDGGNYEIWSCSMGGQVLGIEVKALQPQDSSALIVDALLVIREELKPFIKNRHEELRQDRYFAGTDMERSAFRFYQFLAGDGGLGSNLDIGKMSFVFYTNQSEEQIRKELNEVLNRANPRLEKMGVRAGGFQPLSRYFHCLSLPDEDETLQTMKKAAEEIVNRPVKISGACLSDLSVFLKYGSPVSFSFGIIRDFQLYGGAHQYDEFVDQKEFHDHCKALALFLLRWCGAHISG
jgi:acetylornithine deacetylase